MQAVWRSVEVHVCHRLELLRPRCCFSLHRAVQLSASGATRGSAAAVGLLRAVILHVKLDNGDWPQFRGLEWTTMIDYHRLSPE